MTDTTKAEDMQEDHKPQTEPQIISDIEKPQTTINQSEVSSINEILANPNLKIYNPPSRKLVTKDKEYLVASMTDADKEIEQLIVYNKFGVSSVSESLSRASLSAILGRITAIYCNPDPETIRAVLDNLDENAMNTTMHLSTMREQEVISAHELRHAKAAHMISQGNGISNLLGVNTNFHFGLRLLVRSTLDSSHAYTLFETVLSFEDDVPADDRLCITLEITLAARYSGSGFSVSDQKIIFRILQQRSNTTPKLNALIEALKDQIPDKLLSSDEPNWGNIISNILTGFSDPKIWPETYLTTSRDIFLSLEDELDELGFPHTISALITNLSVIDAHDQRRSLLIDEINRVLMAIRTNDTSNLNLKQHKIEALSEFLRSSTESIKNTVIEKISAYLNNF